MNTIENFPFLVNVEFTGDLIIVLITVQSIDCWYSLEPPC